MTALALRRPLWVPRFEPWRLLKPLKIERQFAPYQPLQFEEEGHPPGYGLVEGGNDAFTVLLLHCDGTDAATTFPDDSASAHAVTANGNAQVDTAQSKFGGASGLFDGAGDTLTISDSPDWDFGTDDFTIDFWMYRNGAQSEFDGIIATDGWKIEFGRTSDYGNTNGILFELNATTRIFMTSAVADATQVHIACVRSGDNYYIFQNGTSVASGSGVSAVSVNSTSGVTIGDRPAAGSYYTGSLDEIRISNGIARWTANFTPPTAAYF